MNNKLTRLILSHLYISPNRKGSCKPTECSTLDGQKGAACCKIDYKCPFLKGLDCGIYKIRPRNCDVFPRTKQDLQLVKNCGYHFD